MNRADENLITSIVRTSRPVLLGAGILFYAIGGGIATYLGEAILWPAYMIGQAMCLLLLLSSFFLKEYFDRPGPPFQRARRPPSQDQEGGSTGPVARVVFLQIALTILTAGAVITVVMLAMGSLDPVGFLFVGLAFLMSLAYAVPPLRLSRSGYGELLLAVMLTNLFPALSYVIQVGELHRLLAMLTFPLTFLFLAASLAQSLPDYLDDIKNNRMNMLLRLGWQRGMGLHNVFIAAGYIVLAFSVIAGLPFRLALPAFLSLPISLYQIWQMNGIAAGGKPRWRLLFITSLASLGLTAYFINLALWTD